MRTFRLVERSPEPGCHEIQVEGEVDLAVVDQLSEAIERGAEHEQILIGLQRCEFIDSTAIALIVRAHQQMTAKGGRVALYGPSNQVHRILSITGLTTDGLVFKDLAEALAADDS